MSFEHLPELQPPSPQPPSELRIALLAAAIAVAPFVVQTVSLVLSQSTAIAALAGAGLLVALLAGGIFGLARTAGSLRAVSPGAVISLVLAVVVYNLFAFPVAYLVNALWFAAPTP